ncbi:unnamed protein product, partial [marine sediment metagenome]
FREGLEGHRHFAQANVFIGNPWNNPRKNIGVASDEEFHFISYKMKVGSYSVFDCGVILPDAVYAKAEAEAKVSDEAEQKAKLEAEEKEKLEAEEKIKAEAEAKVSDEAEEKAKLESEEKEKLEAEEKIKAEAEAKVSDEAEGKAEDQPVAAEKSGSEESKEETAAKEESETAEPVEGAEPTTGPVSETIQKMTQSLAELPGEHSPVSLAICAKDIMQNEVFWGNPNDGVHQALEKMQHANVGYMMVGADGVSERYCI